MFAWLANPQRFMRFSSAALPFVAIAAIILLAVGWCWGLVFSPEDETQGNMVRVMYVHVPAAWSAMVVYGFMTVASFVGLVWRHVLADVAARAAAPLGAAFAALMLITGALWGAPTWGTWWTWDVRMTSTLILFLTYLAYIALWNAVEDETKAARLAAILCLAGAINLPIVHFSVQWWGGQMTLHQKPSLTLGKSAIAPSMLWPLLICVLAYTMAFAALLMAGVRTEIYKRRVLAGRRSGR